MNALTLAIVAFVLSCLALVTVLVLAWEMLR